MGEQSKEGVLELFPHVVPAAALEDLEGFDYIWCIFYCHLNAQKVDPDTGN
jgi:tRNA (Thr-GGU) A37 N-methylase